VAGEVEILAATALGDLHRPGGRTVGERPQLMLATKVPPLVESLETALKIAPAGMPEVT
jgi:hypothetical protein